MYRSSLTAAQRRERLKTEPEMRETPIQERLITEHKFIGRPGTRLRANVNEGSDRKHKGQRIALYRRGLWSGFPDLDVYGPDAGRVRYLELKALDGTVTADQLAAHAALWRLGFDVTVAFGLWEAFEVLEAWGVMAPQLSTITRGEWELFGSEAADKLFL